MAEAGGRSALWDTRGTPPAAGRTAPHGGLGNARLRERLAHRRGELGRGERGREEEGRDTQRGLSQLVGDGGRGVCPHRERLVSPPRRAA